VRRWAWWTLGLAATVGLAVVAFHVFRDPGEKAFDEYVASLRARGEPTTWEELLGPEIPDEENAVAGVHVAWDKLVAERGEPNTWDVPGAWRNEPLWFERLEEDERRRLEALCVKLRPFADEVAAALDRPKARAVRAKPGRSANSAPHPSCDSTVGGVGDVLLATAFMEPDPARRTIALRTMLRADRRFEEAGAWDTGFTFQWSRHLNGVETAVLSRLVDAHAARLALDDVLARPTSRTSGSLVKRERVRLIEEHRAAESRLPFGRLWAALRPPGAAARGLGGVEIRIACERLDRRLDDGLRPARPSSSEALPAGLAKSQRQRIEFSDWMLDSFPDLDALTTAARVVLAVREFHESHGRWPDSLDDVAPSFPLGPPWLAIPGDAFHLFRHPSSDSVLLEWNHENMRTTWDLADRKRIR
jgi:hypothetical protein